LPDLVSLVFRLKVRDLPDDIGMLYQLSYFGLFVCLGNSEKNMVLSAAFLNQSPDKIQRTTRFWDGKGNGKLNSAKFCLENFQVVIHKREKAASCQPLAPSFFPYWKLVASSWKLTKKPRLLGRGWVIF
jgi:hypothetical protein